MYDNFTALKGRQLGWLIFQDYKVKEEQGEIEDWKEIHYCTCYQGKLQQFWDKWKLILSTIDPIHIPNDKMLEALFSKQLRNTDETKRIMQEYDYRVQMKGETQELPASLQGCGCVPHSEAHCSS